MVYPETFEGFATTDLQNWTTVKKIEFEPKKFDSHDIDVRIQACGICGSDIHTLSGGWQKPELPLIGGHEIVGEVVRIGDDVTTLKVGDRCGVGAQIWACLKCDTCKENNEVYCPHLVDTYGARYPDGTRTQGGYASHIRCHEYFAFPIPKELSTEMVAPMLCAGITTYSPLKRNGAGPGKKVGIVGIGGLGHFAIMWAHAMGCEVYVFSRSDAKKADAQKLGSSRFIATDAEDWDAGLLQKLDLIVCCADSSQGFELDRYLKTLRVGGKFVSVGLPEKPFNVSSFSFIINGCCMGSSHLGNRQEMLEMLDLAVKKNIRTWFEPINITAEGVKEGLERSAEGKCKYRIVLTDFDKQFK